MPRAHLCRVACLTLLAVSPLGAQERKSPIFSQLEKLGKSMITLLDRPLHPVLGSVAPGGGVGAGLAFETPPRQWRASLQGLYTSRRYWSTEATLDYSGARLGATVYGRVRDMPKIDFFGAGPLSVEDERSNFAFKEGAAGAVAALRVAPWLTLGARAEQLWPDIGPGRSSNIVSIERRFSEADAPGLMQQPRFGRYDGSIDLIVPAGAAGSQQQGGQYRLTYSFFDDQELGRFSFRRLEAEGQQRFAPFGTVQRLTLHGWLSTTTTSTGHDVPFYLQRTLGGNGDLRGVRESLIGSDGTHATLRGFTDYRFRDRHLVLVQAEYRIPLWGPIDATLFAEGGKVAARRDDLNLSDLERSYGGSLSFMRGATTAARLDIGFGAEGPRVFFVIGSDFKP